MIPSEVPIAVVGAGFSGICAAIQLKKAGFDEFIVFEASDDIGGTWRQNTYPGCACDVPSVLYCFSFEQYLPPENFSSQSNILAYQHHCMDKYKLWPHVKLHTRVTAAAFDDSSGSWSVTTSDGQQTAVRVLILAQGLLNTPRTPNIPGLDSFPGCYFHTAAWDHSCKLAGQRVAVIGTGASAIQVIPAIQPVVKHLTVFQRSAAWVLNRSRFVSPGWVQRAASRFVWFAKLLRYLLFIFYDVVLGWAITHNVQPILKALEYVALKDMRRHIKDPVLQNKLTPHYHIGCKRGLMSDDYYPALAQPNVQLITSAVKEIRGSTIIAADGTEAEADVIIFATGFDVTHPLRSFDIKGLGGRSLADVITVKPEGYLGVAIAGFPNLFTMLGPNTYLGHNSMIFMMECAVNYIIQALNHMCNKRIKWMTVKQVVQDRYNATLKPRFHQTAWLLGGCSSWYLEESGSTSDVLWPGLCMEYKRRTSEFKASDWDHAAVKQPEQN